jgi:hypothetical protein
MVWYLHDLVRQPAARVRLDWRIRFIGLHDAAIERPAALMPFPGAKAAFDAAGRQLAVMFHMHA